MTNLNNEQLYWIAVRAQQGDTEDWEELTPTQQAQASEVLEGYSETD